MFNNICKGQNTILRRKEHSRSVDVSKLYKYFFFQDETKGI